MPSRESIEPDLVINEKRATLQASLPPSAAMRPRRVAGQRCESNGGPPQPLIIIKSTTSEESIQASEK
jgi:hypothetical protein